MSWLRWNPVLIHRDELLYQLDEIVASERRESQPRCGGIHAFHVLVWSEQADFACLCVLVRFQTFKQRARIVQHGAGWIQLQRAVCFYRWCSPARSLIPGYHEHMVSKGVPEDELRRRRNLLWGRGFFDNQRRWLWA